MNLWWSSGAAAMHDNDDHPKRPTSAWGGSIQTFVEGKSAMWQWEHRTGYRNYKDHEVQRIEEAYQAGRQHVRLKSGKENVPMELFFSDMIQHDPITGNSRRIRRLGHEGCCRIIQRLLRRCLRIALEGGMKTKDFKNFQKMRQEIRGEEAEYSVHSFYKTEGYCQRVARSGWFHFWCMLVVMVNSVWICVDADRAVDPRMEQPLYVQVIEALFCLAFVLELALRLGAFARRRSCLRDGWFCLDAVLVVVMVIESWVLPLITFGRSGGADGGSGTNELGLVDLVRMLRLFMLGRITRLLRAVPEAFTMLKGIAAAVRSVFVTLVLLLALLVVFGCIMRTQASDDANLALLFPSVGTAMWQLLLHCTFLDSPTDFLNSVAESSPILVALLLVFILLSSFTVLNLLIGILVDVVSSVSSKEKEKAAELFLKTTLMDILECHDQNGDRKIQKEEFELLMRNPEVHLTLLRFGVDVGDLISLQDLLFEDKAPPMPWDEGESEDEGVRLALRVTLVGAKGLRAMDPIIVSSGKSDPYCICEVPTKAKLQIRTATVTASLNPVWDCVGEIRPYAEGDALRFTVWDRDYWKRDDFLGRTTLRSSQFFPSGFEGDVALSLPTGGECGSVSIKIEVLREPPLGRPPPLKDSMGSLSFVEFLDVVLRLRGGNSATVHDIVELRTVLLDRFDRIHLHLLELGKDEAESRHSPAAHHSARLSRSVRGAVQLQSPRRGEEPRAARESTGSRESAAFRASAAEGRGSLPGMPMLPGEPALAQLEELVAGQRELRQLAEEQAARQEALSSELGGLRQQLQALQAALDSPLVLRRALSAGDEEYC